MDDLECAKEESKVVVTVFHKYSLQSINILRRTENVG